MQARDLGLGIFLDDLDFRVEFNKRNELSVNETAVTCFNGFRSFCPLHFLFGSCFCCDRRVKPFDDAEREPEVVQRSCPVLRNGMLAKHPHRDSVSVVTTHDIQVVLNA